MLKKKVLAIVSACALALALPVSAYAETYSNGSWSVAPLTSYTHLSNVVITPHSDTSCSISYDFTSDGSEELTGDEYSYVYIEGPASAVGQPANVSGFFSGNYNMYGDYDGVSNLTLWTDWGDSGHLNIEIGGGSTSAPDNTPDSTPAPDQSGTTGNVSGDQPSGGNADNNSGSASSDKNATTSKTSPKTGYDMDMMAFGTLTALAGAGVVALVLRKKLASEK